MNFSLSATTAAVVLVDNQLRGGRGESLREAGEANHWSRRFVASLHQKTWLTSREKWIAWKLEIVLAAGGSCWVVNRLACNLTSGAAFHATSELHDTPMTEDLYSLRLLLAPVCVTYFSVRLARNRFQVGATTASTTTASTTTFRRGCCRMVDIVTRCRRNV